MDGVALMAALSQPNQLRHLVSQGADINKRDPDGDRTALHWAADRGLLEVTNLLLDYDADVNVRDLNEATPLIAAARANALATARSLLARGALRGVGLLTCEQQAVKYPR